MNEKERVKFTCPQCNHEISVGVERAGMPGQCPSCGKIVEAPAYPIEPKAPGINHEAAPSRPVPAAPHGTETEIAGKVKGMKLICPHCGGAIGVTFNKAEPHGVDHRRISKPEGTGKQASKADGTKTTGVAYTADHPSVRAEAQRVRSAMIARERKRKLVVLLGVALLIVPLALLVVPSDIYAPMEVRRLLGDVIATAADTYEVEYRVTGQHPVIRANVTVRTPQGTEQRQVRLPWSQTYTFDAGDVAVISAQKVDGVPMGEIRVSIRADGQTQRRASSTAEYGVAQAEWLVEDE